MRRRGVKRGPRRPSRRPIGSCVTLVLRRELESKDRIKPEKNTMPSSRKPSKETKRIASSPLPRVTWPLRKLAKQKKTLRRRSWPQKSRLTKS